MSNVNKRDFFLLETRRYPWHAVAAHLVAREPTAPDQNPRSNLPRPRRPLSFVLSNARDVKNVDRALDCIAVYRARIGEERSSSLRTIFANTQYFRNKFPVCTRFFVSKK